jgi:hypothetical protein
LRFRSLAWEGDTVFEQHRALNFPSWEDQLDQIGATAIIAEFGQMECLAAPDRFSSLQDRPKVFTETYEAFLRKLHGLQDRRVVVVLPPRITSHERPWLTDRMARNFQDFHAATVDWATRLTATGKACRSVDPDRMGSGVSADGVHRSEKGQLLMAASFREVLRPWLDLSYDWQKDEAAKKADAATCDAVMEELTSERLKPLLTLIRAKNRLWFDYWRVQNWAFLAGDRTNQPSSRDWRDPSKRWFPAEREEFLPLIEAKEKEIETLAAQLK